MKTANRFLGAIAGFGLAMAVAQNGEAAVLLSDNFDADSSSSVLNFNGFINWTVDSGTVDYIRSGDFGINCVGGAGGCVDSDGSSSDAGRLVSKATFTRELGSNVAISLDVSGNQRGGTSDLLNIGLIDTATNLTFSINACFRAPSDSYSACNVTFTVINDAFTTYRVFIEGLGNDNIGAVFDNFVLQGELATAQVPEPGALALIVIGLAGFGFSRRKRAGN
jgi:PEP-CTERM motif-containing protein